MSERVRRYRFGTAQTIKRMLLDTLSATCPKLAERGASLPPDAIDRSLSRPFGTSR